MSLHEHMKEHFHAHHGCGGHPKHRAFRIGGWVLLGIGLAVLFALVFAVLVQFFWNALMR